MLHGIGWSAVHVVLTRQDRPKTVRSASLSYRSSPRPSLRSRCELRRVQVRRSAEREGGKLGPRIIQKLDPRLRGGEL